MPSDNVWFPPMFIYKLFLLIPDVLQSNPFPISNPSFLARSLPISPLWHLFLQWFFHVTFSLSKVLINFTLSLTSDNFPVIVDSGCTIAASGDLDNFEPLSYTAAQNVTLHGISAGLKVAGIGYDNWTFTDQQNKPVTMRLHAIHVPGLAVHLLPPQQIVSTPSANCNNSFIGGPTGITLIYNNHEILFSYDHHTNLPTRHTVPGALRFTSFTEQPTLAPPPGSTAYYAQAWIHAYAGALISTQSEHTNDTTPIPSNLMSAQLELLRAHYQFGHINFSELQQWAKQGLCGLQPNLAKCRAPLCAACLYGTMRKRPHNGSTGALSDNAHSPGDIVSVDQMVSGIGGHIPFQAG